MCDAAAGTRRDTTAGQTPAPLRWRGLYAVLAIAFLAAALLRLTLPPSSVRTGAIGMVAGTTVLAVFRWLAAHRSALDLAEWCDCASQTVTVRVITSRGSQPRPASSSIVRKRVLAPASMSAMAVNSSSQ